MPELRRLSRHPTTSAKRKRMTQPLVSRQESCWWKKFLTDEKRILHLDMNTWEARDILCLPFNIFLKLYDMTISNGWYDPHRKDCTNLLCKDLNLLLLGTLYTLATSASHLYVYIVRTDISKELNANFSFTGLQSLQKRRMNMYTYWERKRKIMMTYCKIMMTYCNEFLMTAVPLGFEGV